MKETRQEDVTTDDAWEDELISGHEYDGIREYDNPIPGWLSLLFIGTIIWSLFYVAADGLNLIDDYQASYEKRLRAVQKKQQASSGGGEVEASALASAVDNESRVDEGQQLFSDKCASCHGPKGGGQVGPNLTDDYWIHGGALNKIYDTVNDGVPDKGMPAWGGRLSTEEVVSVVAYIRSIRGSEPPGAQEAEGEKFVPGN